MHNESPLGWRWETVPIASKHFRVWVYARRHYGRRVLYAPSWRLRPGLFIFLFCCWSPATPNRTHTHQSGRSRSPAFVWQVPTARDLRWGILYYPSCCIANRLLACIDQCLTNQYTGGGGFCPFCLGCTRSPWC